MSAPVKVLMLHGYTQSGPLFRAKTRALEKAFAKAFPPGSTFVYPTAPIALKTSDLTFLNKPDSQEADAESANPDEPAGYSWWKRRSASEISELDRGFETIAKAIAEEGPFDGVIGFSQGAAAGAMLASLLETGRREQFAGPPEGSLPFPPALLAPDGAGLVQPPLKFAVLASGFIIPGEYYDPLYEPPIRTPVLLLQGSLDTVVDESRMKALAERTESGRRDGPVVHTGGHFVPTGKAYVNTMLSFMKEHTANDSSGTEKGGKAPEGDDELDMPGLPF